jgi:hypothetical protein
MNTSIKHQLNEPLYYNKYNTNLFKNHYFMFYILELLKETQINKKTSFSMVMKIVKLI